MKDLLLSDSLKGAERQETKLFSSALHTQTFCLLRFVSSKRTRSKKKNKYGTEPEWLKKKKEKKKSEL